VSWSDVVFTFPFTIPTLIIAVLSYLVSAPFLMQNINQRIKIAVWIGLAIIFSFLFTTGYGFRFLLAILIMLASRMRLTQTGLYKEIIMIVITLVTAMLFVGLR